MMNELFMRATALLKCYLNIAGDVLCDLARIHRDLREELHRHERKFDTLLHPDDSICPHILLDKRRLLCQGGTER